GQPQRSRGRRQGEGDRQEPEGDQDVRGDAERAADRLTTGEVGQQEEAGDVRGGAQRAGQATGDDGELRGEHTAGGYRGVVRGRGHGLPFERSTGPGGPAITASV